MQESPTRGLTLFERILNIGHNIRYRATALLQQYPIDRVLQEKEVVYLLGRQYVGSIANMMAVNRAIEQHFKSVIWITYRSGFPFLLKNSDSSAQCVTDAGWGCMVRVGQMMFAEIVKSFLKPKTQQEVAEICEYFNDFRQDGLFSIQRIAQKGQEQFNLAPGQWYNSSKITYILSEFLNEGIQKLLQNLKCVTFKNSGLFFDQILNMFDPHSIRICSHQQDQDLVCSKCNTSSRSVAIIIICRLGLNEPEGHYLSIVNEMMSWRWFRGLSGGKSQRALYFLGRKESEYIYLDPHYVQKASGNVKDISQSYFCNSWRQTRNTSIAPSMGICFYLDSLADLNQFYLSMQNLKKSRPQHFFIFMADQTPSYMKPENAASFQKQVEESCQFQVI